MKEIILRPLAKKIKSFYDKGLYNYEQVEEFYFKDKITREEFREITQAN